MICGYLLVLLVLIWLDVVVDLFDNLFKKFGVEVFSKSIFVVIGFFLIFLGLNFFFFNNKNFMFIIWLMCKWYG